MRDEEYVGGPGRAVRRKDQNTDVRIARLEAVAAAVERWLADPRYVTEQLMMKALRELRELDEPLASRTG